MAKHSIVKSISSNFLEVGGGGGGIPPPQTFKLSDRVGQNVFAPVYMSPHCMTYVVRREGTPDLFGRCSCDRTTWAVLGGFLGFLETLWGSPRFFPSFYSLQNDCGHMCTQCVAFSKLANEILTAAGLQIQSRPSSPQFQCSRQMQNHQKSKGRSR